MFRHIQRVHDIVEHSENNLDAAKSMSNVIDRVQGSDQNKENISSSLGVEIHDNDKPETLRTKSKNSVNDVKESEIYDECFPFPFLETGKN